MTTKAGMAENWKKNKKTLQLKKSLWPHRHKRQPKVLMYNAYVCDNWTRQEKTFIHRAHVTKAEAEQEIVIWVILYIKALIFPILSPDLAPSPHDPIYTCDSVTDFSIPCSLASKIPWSIVNATGVTGGSWLFNAIPTSKSSVKLLELHPNPSPAWKVPSGTQSSLKETELKNHDLSVKISRVSVKDRGTYTCSLEFGLRKLSSRVQVEVLQGEHDPMKNLFLKLFLRLMYK